MNITAVRYGRACHAGDLLLVLCLTMAGAVLGASFAVFLVRERNAGSKAVQLVAGAPPTAFWGATLAWDLAAFSVPAAGIIVCFLCFDLPQARASLRDRTHLHQHCHAALASVFRNDVDRQNPPHM